MNKVKQHIPTFVDADPDADPPEVMEFESLEELLAIPWVKSWSTHVGFRKFSQSVFKDKIWENGAWKHLSGAHLMAEFRKGKEWWVVAILKEPVEGLPEWDKGIYEVVIDGKKVDMPGTQVSGSCGDEVYLRDGRTVIRQKRS